MFKNMLEECDLKGYILLSNPVDMRRTVVLVVLCRIMYNVNNNYNANAKIQKKLQITSRKEKVKE